jgi:hypothetical protein
MGRTGYPETSVTIHQPAPRHITEERMPELHRDGRLRTSFKVFTEIIKKNKNKKNEETW